MIKKVYLEKLNLDYDETIKYLKDSCGNEEFNMDGRVIINVFELFEAKLNYMKNKILPASIYKPQWINIKQALPEEDEYVLTCSGYNCIRVGFLKNGLWLDFSEEENIKCEYWMPLPESPGVLKDDEFYEQYGR